MVWFLSGVLAIRLVAAPDAFDAPALGIGNMLDRQGYHFPWAPISLGRPEFLKGVV